MFWGATGHFHHFQSSYNQCPALPNLLLHQHQCSPQLLKSARLCPKITLRQELISHSGMSRSGAQVLSNWVLRCWLIGHPGMAQSGAQA